MESRWTTPVTPEDDIYDSILSLIAALRAGKTSDPDRLRAKIGKIWSALDLTEKKVMTQKMLKAGYLKTEPPLDQIVTLFDGTITELA